VRQKPERPGAVGGGDLFGRVGRIGGTDCADRGDVVMTVAEWRRPEPEFEEDDANDMGDPGVTTTKTLYFTVVDAGSEGMAIVYVRAVFDTQTTGRMMAGGELYETSDYTTETTNYEIVGPRDLLGR